MSETERTGCAFIGCVHLLPLPGSPRWDGRMSDVEEQALREVEIYARCGADGLIIENTFDVPYLRQEAEPATIAAMARVAARVRGQFRGPVGIQILAGADLAALDTAIACELDFVRVEGFAFAHVADEGLIQAEAGRLLRRRAQLAGQRIKIWADVKKKHSSHALTADLSLKDAAEAAIHCGADKVIITGKVTGDPPDVTDVQRLAGLGIPVVVGSGVTEENIRALGRAAGAVIVGSACKTGGHWRGEVEQPLVERLLQTLRG